MIKYSRTEYNEIFLTSKTILRRSFFYVRIGEIPGKNKSIFVLSKKVGNAVKRNKIRRLFRVLFARHQLLMNHFFTIVLIFNKKPIVPSFSIFENEVLLIKNVLEKIIASGVK